MRTRKETVTIAKDAAVSSAFTPPEWCRTVGANFPAMDNGDVNLEISVDGGSTYGKLGDPQDGAKLVAVASGEDPMSIDLSYFLVPFIGNFETYASAVNTTPLIRFASAAQTTAAVSIVLLYKD